MTTTPTIWKSSFSPNSALAGSQTVPQSIGLANGNILVVWEDDTQGPGAFTDIIGQMFTAEGIAIGPAFQVNSAITASDETGPKLVALPDGGYVVAYGSYLEATGGFITIERFDADGNEVSSRFILDGMSSLTDWDISADSAGNYTVVFERLVGSIDIHSITYDYATNAPGLEQTNLAQNSSDDDRLGATAEFADGRVVTFYTEPDDWWLSYIPPFQEPGTTFEFTITNSVTGATVRGATEIASPETRVAGRAQDVTILTGGQIVLLYSLDRVDGELAMKIVADGSSNGSISSEIIVDASFSLDGDGDRGFENARVVALQDGGFLVAWIVDAFLFAGRYDAAGALIGSKIVADQEVATGQTALFDLSLTNDGRVLIPFIKNTGEIAEVILDPRDNVIIGTDGGEVLTTQITSTQIFGLGGDDTIFGQDGDDNITGGLGYDALHGGNGNDTFHLSDMTRLGQVAWYIFYDEVIEKPKGGIDTVYVEPISAVVNYYTLTANVENGIVDGVNSFNLSGNNLGNRLVGNFGDNVLSGLAGKDALYGGLGNDTLLGGVGNDKLFADEGADLLRGGAGRDLLRGGGDNDIMQGGGGKDTLVGATGNDRLTGGASQDYLTGGTGNDKFTYIAKNEGNDIITDFSSTGAGNNDSFYFKGSGFGGLAKGSIAANEFQSSAAAVAKTADVRFFYETDTGILRFDDDGNGAHAAIIIATLQAGASVDISDILII